MDVLTIISIGAISTALISTWIVLLKLKIELEKLKIEDENCKIHLVLSCIDLIDKLNRAQDREGDK